VSSGRDVLLSLLAFVGFGICLTIPQDIEAAETPYFTLDLSCTLDSQPKHSLRIGLQEPGKSELLDTVPPPEASGFDFYIASGLPWPWDRLSLYVVPQVAGQRVYSWRVVVVVPTNKQATISWDASGAPANLNPYFVEIDPGTGGVIGNLQDMKSTTSTVIQGGVIVATTKAFEFRMYTNLPPVLGVVGNKSVAENQKLSFQLIATDPDGDTVSYSGSPLPSGATLNSSTGAFSWTPGFEQAGTYSVTFTVTDSAFPQKSDLETVSIHVANTNRPPSISSVSISPTTAYESTTLTATPSGWADADGDPPGYNHQWKKNGSNISGATTSTLTGSYFSKGDAITCQVTPWDGTDAGTPVVSNSVTIRNSPPSISSVSISPTTAYESTTLTATPSGWSDADGDSPGYNYQWKKNGSNISGATTSTLTGSYFSKGDTITCQVTPWDGTDAGAPVVSNSVTIRNSPPSISSVSISPTTAYESTTLTATPSGWADPDGDPPGYNYQWKKNGSNISGATTSTLTGSYFSKGDVITCQVTPWDGTDAGTSVLSNAVTILDDPRTLNLGAGWNLVGISRRPINPATSSIFGSVAVGTIWGWDGTKYVPVTSVEPLRAYWVPTTAPASIRYDCLPLSASTPDLSSSWNMFAVGEETPLPLSNSNTVGSVWGWDGTKYTRAVSSLQPDRGYWVATTAAAKNQPAREEEGEGIGILHLRLLVELSGINKGALEIGLLDTYWKEILEPAPPPTPDGFTCYILGDGPSPFICLWRKMTVLSGDAERASWIVVAHVPARNEFSLRWDSSTLPEGIVLTIVELNVGDGKPKTGSLSMTETEKVSCLPAAPLIFAWRIEATCRAPASRDADGNLIADEWERENFPGGSCDPYADPDADGMNNMEEFIAGTDPNNPSSALLLFDICKNARSEGVMLWWETKAGRKYQVLYRDSLIDGEWRCLGKEVEGIGGAFSIRDDTVAADRPHRFYRLRVW